MFELLIAAGQTTPAKGDISLNIRQHKKLIELAAKKDARLIHFPELSITGYEPELAEGFAFEFCDPRLKPLQKISSIKNIIVVVGAPLESEKGIQIASFILYPDGSQEVYTKHYLHRGEEKYFVPGTDNPQIELGNLNASLAICADITHKLHIQSASASGSVLYLPGVFLTPKAYSQETDLLARYARRFGLAVLLANFGGSSGNYQSAGKSACWDNSGNLLAQLPAEGNGVVLAAYRNTTWTAKSIIL